MVSLVTDSLYTIAACNDGTSQWVNSIHHQSMWAKTYIEWAYSYRGDWKLTVESSGNNMVFKMVDWGMVFVTLRT